MQSTVEVQRSRPRHQIEWKSRVIPWNDEVLMDELTGINRPVFEDLLNEAFNDLAAHGYHVTEVRPYPNGFVVLANRVTTGQQAVPQPSVVREDVTYYWQNKGETNRDHFDSLAAAVKRVAKDVASGDGIPKALERTVFSVYNREELEDLVATI